MSSLLELLLLAAFFITFKWQGIYAATAVLMAGSVLVLAVSWWRTRKLEPLPLMVTVLALVLGSVTLLLHDPVFIKWKFSIIEWLLGLVLLGSQYVGAKPFVRRALESQFQLPDGVWRRLNFMWAAFFLFLGTLNVFVIYNFSTAAWVDFKFYGVTGLLLLFALAQALYLSRHLPQEKS